MGYLASRSRLVTPTFATATFLQRMEDGSVRVEFRANEERIGAPHLSDKITGQYES